MKTHDVLHVEMGRASISIFLNYTTPTENILDWLFEHRLEHTVKGSKTCQEILSIEKPCQILQ